MINELLTQTIEDDLTNLFDMLIKNRNYDLLAKSLERVKDTYSRYEHYRGILEDIKQPRIPGGY